MTTNAHHLTIGGIQVTIVRKEIRNLHLGVYPPDGRVRVAVPMTVSDAAVRSAVVGKLRWIGRQQAAFKNQLRQSAREMVSGESHFFLGRRYRLRLVEANQPRRVAIHSRRVIELRARPNDSVEQRRETMDRWYRNHLREMLPLLLEKWQQAIGVAVAACGIKKMKTKWGSSAVDSCRIWLNLELIKKPPECLEYLVVHELLHLRVRHHDDQFRATMDRLLPRWNQTRKVLNAAPLAHANWTY
jgi:predicted metal-dependent hydrolase